MDELENAIRETEARISKLPRATSNNPVGEVLHALDVFSRDLSRRLEGTPDKDGLLQTIRPYQQEFRRAIRSTAPNFVPWEKKKKGTSLPKANFLQNEEGGGDGDGGEGRVDDDLSEEETQDSDRNMESTVTLVVGERQIDSARKTVYVDQKIYIDEVLKWAQRYAPLPCRHIQYGETRTSACTRELPDSYPFVVQQTYIKEFTKKWRTPAMDLFDRVYATLKADLDRLVEKHFAHMGKGTARQSVLCVVGIWKRHHDLLSNRMIVNDHLDRAVKRTRIKIESLLSLEQVPMTLNTHYFSDYKDKFLAHYRASRNDSDLLSKLKQAKTTPHLQSSPCFSRAPGPSAQQDPYQSVVNKVLSGLNEIGISVKATELAKLLPLDPMEPALNIMANVRAYFQGEFPVGCIISLTKTVVSSCIQTFR